MAKYIDRAVDEGDIAQHSWSDAIFVVGSAVLTQSRIGIGAFIVIIASLFIHYVPAELFEVFEVETL